MDATTNEIAERLFTSAVQVDGVYDVGVPDRDVFTSRLSLAVTMPRGFSAFVSVDALFGHSYLDHYGAALGLRKEL